MVEACIRRKCCGESHTGLNFVATISHVKGKLGLRAKRWSMWFVSPTAAYLNTGIILMNQGYLDEAKRTFLTCAEIPDENLKDPHAHKSSVTSCLYNLGKLLHEQGRQEVATRTANIIS